MPKQIFSEFPRKSCYIIQIPLHFRKRLFNNYTLTNTKTQRRDENGMCDFNSCLTQSTGWVYNFSKRTF